jgi:hypothetical protein
MAGHGGCGDFLDFSACLLCVILRASHGRFAHRVCDAFLHALRVEFRLNGVDGFAHLGACFLDVAANFARIVAVAGVWSGVVPFMDEFSPLVSSPIARPP